MIICDDEFWCEFDGKDFLNQICESMIDKKDVELVFVDDKTMQNINQTQRNINKSTDVLSFPLAQIAPNLLLGSIVINLDLAKIKASEFKHSLRDEIALLFIHANLHLLGFDHEKDKGEMREKEAELISKFNLPKSLIIRTLE